MRQCGSTTAITNIIEQLTDFRVAVVCNTMAMKRMYERLLNHCSHVKFIMFQSLTRPSGLDVDILFLTDAQAPNPIEVNYVLLNIRALIVVKEIFGKPPYEIYN